MYDFDERQRSWWENKQLKLGMILFSALAVLLILLILLGVVN